MTKTLWTTVVRDGSTCFLPVPFDPGPVLGTVRARAETGAATHPRRGR